MKDLQNYELIAAVIDDWTPSDLAFIKTINLFPNEENRKETDMLIHFLSQSHTKKNVWPDGSADFFDISLMFRGIADLQLKLSGSGLHQISDFDIIDIKERAWERLNFIVDDDGHGVIRFYCAEIAVVSVSGRGG